jgi:hypothetical protein
LNNKPNRNSGTSNNGYQGNKGFNPNDFEFITITMKNNFSSNMWILDSGASCHYCRPVERLTEVKEINESIKIGNGDSMKASKIEN